MTDSPRFKASQEGIEPPTYSLGGCRSILLSYWDKIWNIHGIRIRMGKMPAGFGLSMLIPAAKNVSLPAEYISN